LLKNLEVIFAMLQGPHIIKKQSITSLTRH